MKKYEKTYGKEGAKVRNRIFKRILAKAQDGTKAGQWSARKAQSLTEDYEKAMGKKGKKPYKSSKKTKSQKSLKDWGDQDWKTKSGKKSSKTGERYLPAKAIDSLTDEEYKKTSAKKRKDMKKGKQFSDQPKSIAKKVKKYRAEKNHIHGDLSITKQQQNRDGVGSSVYIETKCHTCGAKGEGFQSMKNAETFEAQVITCDYCEKTGGDLYSTVSLYKCKEGCDVCSECLGDNDYMAIQPYMEECCYEHFDVKPTLGAETFESESSKPYSVTISRSSNPEKKLMAVFEDSEGKKTKTTHFGQRGASDYTKHGEKERMERYLERHGGGFETSTKENWKDPTTAGALSRWILWNKPSLKASFDDYKSRFGLKGSIKVSKSAETFEATEWVGFCPECNKWRTKEMSVKIDSKVGIGWSIPDELVGKRLCRKSQRFGKITNHSSSWSGYGQRTHEDSYCGTPLTKVKSKYKAEERKCKSCEKPATNVVQEGSFCYDCLPINLGAENEAKFPILQFAGSVLLVSLLPLFLDNRRDKV